MASVTFSAAYPSGAPEFIPGYFVGFVLFTSLGFLKCGVWWIILSSFVHYLSAIVFSVIFLFMASDNSFDIIKLVLLTLTVGHNMI